MKIFAILLFTFTLGARADFDPLSAVTKSCSGCCSSHGGVSSFCGIGGRIMCNDGTTSPTCACSSCGGSSPPAPSCSYTYSDWSACQPGNTQTRVVTGSSPFGCTGSPGPLSQFCAYTAPPAACTYTYSDWSACQSNNTQTRTVTGTSPFGCTGTPAPLSQACTFVAPVPTAVLNYTAMWWNPAESGWGLNINHQDSTLFATLFTYAADGLPMWLVASNLSLQIDGSFTGALYRVSGPVFNASPWTAVNVSQVGTMTIRFTTDHTATLVYSMGTATVSKSIEKEVFGTPTVCTGGTGSRAPRTNYQDMWWNPNESGWGINLTHQGSIIFAVLFTYDATGRDWWLVASNLAHQADGSFSGSLYSTSGPVFSAAPWNTASVGVTQVGSMTLRFINGESATLNYSVNGVSVTKTIQREVFGAIVPMCQ